MVVSCDEWGMSGEVVHWFKGEEVVNGGLAGYGEFSIVLGFSDLSRRRSV